MSIREDSKKIAQYFLEQAISCGTLEELFPLQYDELAQKLNLKDANYCRVCCQYLSGMGYISINARAKELSSLKISLRAPVVDFLETT